MDYILDEDFPSRFRKEPIFSAIQFFYNPIPQVAKLMSLTAKGRGVEPQLEIMPLADQEEKVRFDIRNTVLRGILTEGNSRLVKVDLLARRIFISDKARLYCVTILLVGFEKDKTVISEEEMGDHETAPCHLTPCKTFR